MGSVEVEVAIGSLLDVTPRPSALVSSDNNYLSHGGSVSKAIWDAAGPALEQEAARLSPPFQLGDVIETTGGALDALVFHAVVVDYDRNVRIRAVELTPLVAELLVRADARGAESIALPLLGTGVGRVPVELATRAIVEGIFAAAQSNLATLRRVVLVARDHDLAERVRSALDDSVEAPDLAALVDAAAARAPQRIGGAMRAAVADLPTATRPWALVALTETALQALGAEALAELASSGDAVPLPPDLAASLGEAVSRRLVRADGQLARELPPGLAQSQLHAAVRALRRHTEEPLPRHVDAAIAAAVDARNRVAHGSDDVAPILEGQLATIYAYLAGDEPAPQGSDPLNPFTIGLIAGVGGFVGALGATAISMWRKRSTTSEFPASEPPRPLPPPPEEQAADDAHVRLFVGLVRELLTEERVTELSDELASLGYRGEPHVKLLEYAVRHEDPAGWLADELSITVLRKELEKRVGAKPEAHLTGRALAEQLMELLGFPRTRRIEGLQSAIRAVERARTRAHAATASEINGLVLSCATHVERAVLVLLRFVCKAGFGLPPELYFRQRHPKLIDPERPLDRASLGSVLALLERLAKDFESSDEPRAMVLRTDLGGEPLVPKNATAIAQMRNQFAHLRDENARPPIQELRQRATAFFDAALELFEYFARPEHRVYPRVIRVKMVRIDAWRRRVVEAEDEQGDAEFIFSSRPMMPGEVYYMHPLTNPFRVDPILVEAGDLASASTTHRE